MWTSTNRVGYLGNATNNTQLEHRHIQNIFPDSNSSELYNQSSLYQHVYNKTNHDRPSSKGELFQEFVYILNTLHDEMACSARRELKKQTTIE
jgi:hypothetical protein